MNLLKVKKYTYVGLLGVFFLTGILFTSQAFSNAFPELAIVFGEDRWEVKEKFEKEWTSKENVIAFEVDVSFYYQKVMEENLAINPKRDIPFVVESAQFNDVEIVKNNIKIEPTAPFNGIYRVQVSLPRQPAEGKSLHMTLLTKVGNKFGIPEEESFTFSIKRDTTAPMLTISGVESEKLYTKDVVAHLQMKEENFKTSKVEIEVTKDGENYDFPAFSLTGATSELTHTFTEEGHYSIRILAEDGAGNQTENNVTFGIDKNGPSFHVPGVNENQFVNKRENTLHIAHSLPIKEIMNVSVVTGNGQPYSGITKDQFEISGKKATLVHTFPLDDTYTIHVTLKDAYRPNGVQLSPYVIKVDATTPVYGLTGVTNNAVYDTNQQVLVNVQDSNLDEEHTYLTIKKDGTATTEKIGNVQDKAYDFTEEGVYELVLEVQDLAGNEGKQSLTFTIDKSNPVVTVTGVEDGVHYAKNRPVTMTVSDFTLQNEKLEVLKDGKVYSSVPSLQREGKIAQSTFTFTEEGSYRITLSAEDALGRKVNKVITFVVDKTAPKLVLSGVDHDFIRTPTVTLEIIETYYETNDVSLVVTKDNQPYDAFTWENTGQITSKSHVFIEEGNYEITLSATDKAGNDSTVITKQFIVDNTAPVITIDGVQSDAHYKQDKEVTIHIQEQHYTHQVVALNVKKDGTPYDVGKWESTDEISTLTHLFKEEGNYEIVVQSQDAAGNKGESHVIFVIDKTAPIVSIEGPKNGAYVNEVPTVTLTVNEKQFATNEVMLQVTKNKQPYSMGQWNNTGELSTLSHNFKEDGVYTVTLTAQDKAENGPVTETLSFVVDQTAPIVSVEGVEDKGKYTENKVMEITVQDVNLDTGKSFLSITKNNKKFVEKQLDSNTKERYELTEDGTYEVTLYARDKANNFIGKKMTFVIDKVAPSITIFGVENQQHYPDTTANIKIQDMILNQEQTVLEMKKDGQAYETPSLIFEENIATMTYHFKENGVYELSVVAKDFVGNTSEQTLTFTIDHVAPVVSLTGIENGAFLQGGQTLMATVHEQWFETNTVAFKVIKDNQPYEAFTWDNLIDNTGEISSKKYVFTEDGTYHVTLVAVDKAGNTSSQVEQTFTVDNIAPSISISGVTNGTHYAENREVTISVTEREYEGNTVTVTVTKDGKPLTIGTWENSGSTSSLTYTFDKDATYVIQVVAQDQAGNKSESTVSFTIDTISPGVNIDGPAEGTFTNQDQPVVLTVEEKNYETNTVDVVVTKDLLPFSVGEWVNTGLTSQLQHTFVENGAYSIQLRATDQAGNESSTARRRFTIDKQAPTLSITGIEHEQKYGVNQIATISVYDKYLHDAEVTILKNGNVHLQEKLQNGKKSYVFNEDALYEIILSAEDRATNKRALGRTFTIDKTEPQIVISGIENDQHYRETNLTLSVTDLTLLDTTLQVTKDGKEYKLPAFQHSINEDGETVLRLSHHFKEDGVYELAIRVVDEVGYESSKKVRFVIDSISPEVSWSGIEDDAFIQGNKTLSVTVKERHYDTNNVLFTVTKDGQPYPDFTWENTGEVSTITHLFTDDGEYTLSLQATDKAGNASSTITKQFTVDNIAPKITIAGVEKNTHYQDKRDVTITIEEHNYAGNNVSIVVKKDNKVMDIGKWSNSGESSSLNYTFTEEGTYDINVLATDQAGNTTTSQVTFTLDRTAPHLNVTAPMDKGYFNTDQDVIIEVEEINYETNDVQVVVTKDLLPYSMGQWQNTAVLSELRHTFTSDGVYHLSVSATDKAGNGPSLARKQFTIDKTAPQVVITGVDHNKKYNENRKMTVQVVDTNLVESQTTLTVLKNGKPYIQEQIQNNVIKEYDFTEDGVYEVTVVAEDKATNMTTMGRTFTIDKTEPKVTITGIEKDAHYQQTKMKVTIEDLTLNIDTTTLVVKKDGKGLELPDFQVSTTENDEQMATIEYTFTENGTYAFALETTDDVGHTVSVAIPFVIDNIAPIVSLTGIEDGAFLQGGQTLMATVTEKNFALNTVMLAVTKDGEPYESFTWDNMIDNSGKTSSKKHVFTEDGTYKVMLSAVDKAGNMATTVTKQFTVDNIAPVITIDGVEDTVHYNDNREVTITVKEREFTGNQVNIVATKGNQSYHIGEWQNTGETSILTYTFTEEDNYTITVTAKDQAGHTAESNVSFTVDKTAPVIQIIGPKEGVHYKQDQEVVLTIDERNFMTNDVTLTVTKDNQPYAIGDWQNTGVTSQLTYLFTEDGTYEIVLQATDKATNGPVEVRRRFTVDKTVPQVTLTGVENKQYDNNQQIDINVYDLHLVENETSFVVTKNNKSYLEERITNDTNKSYNFNEDGIYHVVLTAKDQAGNVSVIERHFTIDKTKPILTITNVKQDTHYQERTVTVRVEDLTLDLTQTTLTVTKDNQPYDIPPLKLESHLNSRDEKIAETVLSFKENGVYTIALHAKDELGHEEVKDVTFIIDNIAPVITLSGITNGSYIQGGKMLTVTVDELRYEENVVKLIVTKDGKNYAAFQWDNKVDNTDVTSLKAHPFTEDGDYVVTVNATDAAGNKASQKVLTFTVDNIAPVLRISGVDDSRYYNGNRPVTLQVVEHNYHNNSVQVSVTKNGKAYDIGTWRNTGETSQVNHVFDQDGHYQIRITATDKAGNVAQMVEKSFTIDKTQPVLTIDGVEEGAYYRTDKPVQIKVVDTNLDQQRTIFTVTKDGKNYPIEKLAMNETTATLKVTFKEEGNYVLTLQSTDKANNKEVKTVSFIVDKTAPVIHITGVEDNSFNDGNKHVTITVDELQYGTNTVDIAVTKDKEPLHIGEWKNTGKVSKLSYTFNQDGIYTITVKAIDKATNGPIIEKKTFTIDKTKPEIIITGVEDNEYYNTNKTPSVEIKDNNFNVNKVTVLKDKKSVAVGGFTINGTSAVFQHTFSQEGEYHMTVEATDKAGNTFNTKLMFTIDKTAPVITSKIKGTDTPLTEGMYMNKIFTPEFLLDKPEEDEIVSVVLNGQSVGTRPLTASKEMKYNYKVVAQDKAKNETVLNIQFTVDTTMPKVEMKGIIDGYYRNNLAPNVTYSDTNLDTMKSKVLLNGQPFKNGTVINSDNHYVLQADVHDLAENATSRSVVFTVDKTGPKVIFKEPMNQEYFNEDILPQFTIRDLSDYDMISMTLNGVDYDMGTPITEEGKHVLSLEIKDKAQNVTRLSIEFMLDKTPPVVIYEGVEDKKRYYKPVQVGIRLFNPQDTITSVTINDDLFDGDIIETDNGMELRTTISNIGKYEVVVHATDEAGNDIVDTLIFEIGRETALVKLYENKPLFAATIFGLLGIMLYGWRGMKKE